MNRRPTRVIRVGKVAVGGENPVVVQSMLKTDPQNLPETVKQMRELKRVGCEIVRMALPQESTCDAIPFLRREVDLPLIGDVHFNYTIAMKAIELGIDGIRINPGTINNARKVREIARMAAQIGTPVRIGINVGSLEKRILRKHGRPGAAAMVESALYYVKLFEDEGHREIKVSLKASDVVDTIEAYRMFSEQSDYPLHVGITEAGPLFSGAIKSAVGIGVLLAAGIGDTIRVSLTGDPAYEVAAAYLILRSLRLRERGINIISCPTCGRCKTRIQDMVEEFERETAHIETPLNVAIMGCEVNGPGEARSADVGIAFGANKAILFARGVPKRSDIPKDLAKGVLLEEVYNMTAR